MINDHDFLSRFISQVVRSSSLKSGGRVACPVSLGCRNVLWGGGTSIHDCGGRSRKRLEHLRFQLSDSLNARVPRFGFSLCLA